MTQACKEIINKYLKTEEEIERLSLVTKVNSEIFDHRANKLSGEDWSLIDDMADEVWNSEKSMEEKLKIGFELYEIFPQYHMWLDPVYDAFRDDFIDEPLKKYVYDKFAAYLSSGNESYINTVGYILWVEFFEGGGEISKDIWNGIVSSDQMSLEGKYNLLEFSGPAEYDQKEKFYREILKNKESHPYILKSIAFSLTDLYGRIEKDKAVKIFNQLENVDKTSDFYKVVSEKISQ